MVVQEGVSLVLPCRPPAGLPPPIIFWMDNSERAHHTEHTVPVLLMTVGPATDILIDMPHIHCTAIRMPGKTVLTIEK